MRLIPGSHRHGRLPYEETASPNNLLARGDQLQATIEDDDAVEVILKAGEIFLHHILSVHSSPANDSDTIRMAYTIRYVHPHIRSSRVHPVILARGVDEH